MKRLVLLGVALTALVSAPAAVAHGGGSPGVRSQVTSIRPAQPRLLVVVLGGDDRLRLTNRGAGEVIVYGYEGEPYLRWSGHAVYVNERSPATYVNQDRYGAVPLPAQADAKAPPEWKRVAGGETYIWHDHRIHWMSQQPPDAVQKDPHRAQHIFDWKVPITVDGKRATIRGSLDYTPPAGVDGGGSGLLLRGGIAAGLLAVAAAALLLLTRRRGRPAAAEG
jgi:hypothetical protein